MENASAQDLTDLFSEAMALANQLRRPASGRSILQILDDLGPQTVPQIARARSTSRQNIQILINRLKSAGYIVIAPNPAHQRSSLIHLSPQGKFLLAKTTDEQAKMVHRMSLNVAKSQVMTAKTLLHSLRHSLPPTPMSLSKSRLPTSPDNQSRQQPLPLRSKPASIPESSSDLPDDTDFPVNLL